MSLALISAIYQAGSDTESSGDEYEKVLSRYKQASKKDNFPKIKFERTPPPIKYTKNKGNGILKRGTDFMELLNAVGLSPIGKLQVLEDIKDCAEHSDHSTRGQMSLRLVDNTKNKIKVLPNSSKKPHNKHNHVDREITPGYIEEFDSKKLETGSETLASPKKMLFRYACPYCFTRFANSAGLIEHLPTHANKRAKAAVKGTTCNPANNSDRKAAEKSECFSCHICGDSFSSNRARLSHMKSHEKAKMSFACAKCELSFTRPLQLASHMSIHNASKPWKGSQCNYYFLTPEKLPTHERINPIMLRACTVNITRCDKITNSLSIETKLLQVHEEDKNDGDSQTDQPKVKRQASLSARKKIAKFLQIDNNEGGQEKPPDENEYNETPKTKNLTGESERSSYRISSKTRKDKSRSSEKTKSWSCPICKITFPYQSYLKRHVLVTHTKEKSHVCSICHKQFLQAGSLKSHIKVHTGDKNYECPTCFKQFAHSSSFKLHIKVHTGEKSYECPTCLKIYRERTNLKIHMRVHTGERPYKCLKCDKSFRSSWVLRKHMKRFHPS